MMNVYITISKKTREQKQRKDKTQQRFINNGLKRTRIIKTTKDGDKKGEQNINKRKRNKIKKNYKKKIDEQE